jgi:hypothetical protein
MSMFGSRSAWSAVIALALLATPAAGFLLLLRRDAPTRSIPGASQSAHLVPPAPASASQRARLVVAPSQLAAARSSARRFADQFAADTAAPITAREIVDAAPELIRELRRHPSRITPA